MPFHHLSSVLRTFFMLSLSFLQHVVFANTFPYRSELNIAFNDSSPVFPATPTSSAPCSYSSIRTMNLQWSKAATTLTVGHVMVIVSDDGHKPRYSTSYSSEIVEDGTTKAHAWDFLYNGTLRRLASPQLNTNSAGTVTARVAMLSGAIITLTYPTPLTDIDSKFQWAGSLDAGSTTLTGDTLRPVPIHISLPTVTPSVDPEDPAGLTYAVRSKYHFGIHGADKSWMFDHANGSLSNMFRLIYEQCSVFEPGSFLSPDNSQSGQAVFAGEVQPGLISNYVLATTTVYISASVTTAQSHIVPSESHKTTPKQSFTTFMDSSEGPTTSIVTTAQTSPQFSASKSRAVSKIGVNSKIGSAHRIASSGDSLDPNRLAQTSLKLSTNDVGISETRGNSQGHDLADLVLSFIASSPKISNTLWTTAVDNQFTSGIDTETESEKATGNQVPKTATIQLPSAGMLRITSSNPFRLTKGGSSTRKSATMTTQHFSSSGTEEPQERTSPASSKLGVAASVKSAIEAAITIGSSTVTANSDSVYVLGTQTLSPGGYAVTVSGETLSLASDASILVLDGTSESVYTSINNGGVGGYIWSGFHESGSTTFSQTEYPSTIGVNGVGNATGTAAQPAGFPGQAVSQYSSIFFAFAIAPSLVSIFSILF